MQRNMCTFQFLKTTPHLTRSKKTFPGWMVLKRHQAHGCLGDYFQAAVDNAVCSGNILMLSLGRTSVYSYAVKPCTHQDGRLQFSKWPWVQIPTQDEVRQQRTLKNRELTKIERTHLLKCRWTKSFHSRQFYSFEFFSSFWRTDRPREKERK